VSWAPDYTTAERLKNYLSIQNNADDVFIGLWITTVSRNVDDFCGRQFGQTAAAEDRFYTPVYDRDQRCWFANIDDVQDVTGLTVEDEDGNAVPAHTTTVDGYTLLPRNAAAKGRPYEQLKLDSATGEIVVNVKFGWTAQPSAVETGMFLQAARLNARRRSPFGVAGSPTEGSEVRLLAQLDPDFRTSLKPLQRRWWAG
jgi:hypothetical protein